MHLNPYRLELLRHFRLDRTYVRGEGSWLWDAEGRRVLDLTAQYGAVPLGHNPPELWAALESVRREAIPALVQPSRPVRAEALARRLAELAPVGDRRGDAVVTFAQSGAEGVECAIRLARLSTGRVLVVGAEGGYHGQTLGAAALTWRLGGAPGRLDDAVRPPGFAHVPLNDVAALEELFARRGREVAALVLEPVQGEGGVFEADPAYLRLARALTARHGALLVLDEVQTGLGRTGTLFAAESAGITADVVVLSKALGGGLVPLAACVATREAFSEDFALAWTSTFAENNLTTAVGLAVLDALTARGGALVERVRAAGARLRAGLAAIAGRYPGAVRAVRGRGLLLGLELETVDADRSYFLRHMEGRGASVALFASYLLNVHGVRVIPCVTHGRVLRIEPPLTVTDAEIERALEAIEALVRTLHQDDFAHLVSPLVAPAVAGPAPGPVDRRHLRKPVLASAPLEPREPPQARFAFLIHHTSPEDLVRTTPAFGALSRPEIHALYDWVAARPGHAPVCFMPSIRSRTGARTEGWLVGLSHTPETLLARPRAEVADEVAAAVRAAHRLGADAIGLGAFTSIVSGGGENVAGCPAAVTTGSALTVALAIDGISLACARLGRDPGRLRGLVLGPGLVGSAAAALASEVLPSLTIVGNPGRPERARARGAALMDRIYARAAARLDEGGGVAAALRRGHPVFRRLGSRGAALAERLRGLAAVRGEDGGDRAGDHDLDGHHLDLDVGLHPERGLAAEIAWACAACGLRPPLEHTLDLEAALAEADVVIACSSAVGPLIAPRALKPGAIVCDVARPSDVSASVLSERADVLVFDGGLASYPDRIAFGQNLGLPPGVNLACLTETVVLALEGVRTGRFGFSGRGLPAEVVRIRAAADRHGFGVAGLRVGDRTLVAADFERAARAHAQAPGRHGEEERRRIHAA